MITRTLFFDAIHLSNDHIERLFSIHLLTMI